MDKIQSHDKMYKEITIREIALAQIETLPEMLHC